ncbi:DUF1698 domain-containing protein, partial [Salmonella enterica subsp. enterica serovar Montevideo]|nr:DUF1698 domain-containing protein [Salmonella enterica subsp. enterica serovar Montevideo]
LPALKAFDTVFSMGVLYHRRSPLEHLWQLKDQLVNEGELVLDWARINPPTALLQQTSRPKATTANIDECQRQSGRRSSRAPQCG